MDHQKETKTTIKKEASSEEEFSSPKPRKKWYTSILEYIELSRPMQRRPHIGMRIFKSGLAVFVTMLIYVLWKRPESGAFLALVAAVVSMQDTMGNSLRIGIIRLFATVIGGLIGILLIWPVSLIRNYFVLYAFLLSFATILCITICVWLELREASILSSVVCLAILINEGVSHSYVYALNRILDTAIGIGISVVINIAIRRPPMKNRINKNK
jgi:Predicted membrane protein